MAVCWPGQALPTPGLILHVSWYRSLKIFGESQPIVGLGAGSGKGGHLAHLP